MHVRHDLCRARAVVLYNVVVGDAGDGRDSAGQEGEPEACKVRCEYWARRKKKWMGVPTARPTYRFPDSRPPPYPQV